ncbi:RagB/SusD family nutrient uptake outer membrane protein [Pedobacter sp. GR22-6]|uniref:RagB/SusD family nutrient uptake outer membrane protein n=1 Tax=Pedobacter sp. GR22-6 TaxID=3127957 RepID=UPI00307FBC75
MKRYFSVMVVAALLFSLASCKKMLEVLPEDKLDESQAYRDRADADAAVIGIYGKFLGLSKQYIFMNELRADLMDITPNSDPYMVELSNHAVTEDNPYASPKPFYELILNCNDALKNFNIMVKESRMSVDEYQKRYSDIGALRSWLYLQLGIHFGSVPYITMPLDNVEDVKNINSYPKTSFDALLDSLINFTEKLPYQQSYAYPAGSSLVVTIDGSSTNKIFVNKPALMGDLYLWKGEYLKAASAYKKILTSEDNNPNIDFMFNYYRLGYNSSPSAETSVYYTKSQDEGSLMNSVTTGWRSMFALPNTNRSWNSEWVWSLPYSAQLKPGNPFIEVFSATYGKYQLKASQAAIDNWNSQTQRNGIPYDARGRLSFTNENGKSVITKFTDNAVALTPLNKAGNWNILRAAGVHLKFSEAANRDGKSKLAWALLNVGIRITFYEGTYLYGIKTPANISPANIDELNTQRTPYPEPYLFDARDNSDVARGIWYRNIGIRTRANVVALPEALQTNVNGLEDKLIEEGALELAFEGTRWSDLMRIARRRNDPAFLADKVYQKLLKSGNPNASAVRAKLMDPNNWYLPFR